ncbi:hypothetical protein [Echinicola shivajiensis]|uniref:hypothetical protein n=1 Tax=Echinicola shivajiensis TaxID=1035916 RepID=UPI001BFCAA47|nr:hypothetical protein [Echinicola shivajiensis]
MNKAILSQWVLMAFLTGIVLGAFIFIWLNTGFQTYQVPILVFILFGIVMLSIRVGKNMKA